MTRPVVVELVLPPQNEAGDGSTTDMEKLVIGGSRVRWSDDLVRPLAAADLELTRVVAIECDFGPIEARAA